MENKEQEKSGFPEMWAVLEIMGKSRYGGRVREEHCFGVPMIRIDIPDAEPGKFGMTKYFHPQSLFCITPVSEDAARAVAEYNTAPPVSTWEIPRKQITAGAVDAEDEPDFANDYESDPDYEG